MTAGARTPDELETLFEDATIARDPQALRELFEDQAALLVGAEVPVAHGIDDIATTIRALWHADRFYVPEIARIVQSRDTALTVGRHVNVSRRGADGAWRYLIALMQFSPLPGGTP